MRYRAQGPADRQERPVGGTGQRERQETGEFTLECVEFMLDPSTEC